MRTCRLEVSKIVNVYTRLFGRGAYLTIAVPDEGVAMLLFMETACGPIGYLQLSKFGV